MGNARPKQDNATTSKESLTLSLKMAAVVFWAEVSKPKKQKTCDIVPVACCGLLSG